MSVTPQTTSDIRPIKPLKPYKLYRNQRLNQLSPSQHLYQTIKQEWKNLDGSIKEKMQQQYNFQYTKFLQDKQKWQEKHGPLMLMHKEKSRQKSQNHIVQITMGDDLCQQKSKRPLKRLRKKQCEESSNIVDYEQNYEQKNLQKQWISKIDSNQSYQSQKKIQKNTTNTTKNKKNVKEDLGQQLHEEYKDQQLMIVKKQDKGSEHLISKMNKKVDFFKNRLSFKEADKDFKYKNHIKQKLKTLNQCQEINLIVEIPKVFGGKGCLQGALYLKNVKQRQNIINSQMITCNNQQSNPKDRKSYYQCLEKELRLKKSEVISESAIKQCFKQSSLDQNDSIDQQQVYVKKTQKPPQKIRQAKILSKSLKRRTSTISQISNCSKASFDSIKNEHKQQQSMNIIHNTESSNHSYVSQQKNIQDRTIIRQQIKQEAIENNKNRNNTVKKHKNLLRNHLKGFIEEQAQNSGQEDNSKDGSSSQDDNTNISSLIDNDVYISEKDQILVHNKFVNDMIEKQEKQYQNMRRNLQKKYLQQQQNLRKRMREAAKKNKQKQKQEDKTHLNVSQEEQLIEQCETQNQSCTANHNKKLKQLQIQLGIKPKCNQKVQQKPLCLMPNIQDFEKAMINKKKGDIKKPVRGGMKNVIQLKGVKSNVKIRMKR